jgi:uncharacterized membrane protein YoaK (UPF0700 family)
MSDLIAFRSEKLWRWLTNFWTLVFMVLLVVNFFTGNKYDFLIAPFSVIYVGILGLYVGTKEFDRWYDLHESRHPGELFVIAWTVVIFALLILSIALQDGHKVSSEAIAVYIMVLSVFALTQKSKKLHQHKHRSK